MTERRTFAGVEIPKIREAFTFSGGEQLMPETGFFEQSLLGPNFAIPTYVNSHGHSHYSQPPLPNNHEDKFIGSVPFWVIMAGVVVVVIGCLL